MNEEHPKSLMVKGCSLFYTKNKNKRSYFVCFLFDRFCFIDKGSDKESSEQTSCDND